MVDALPAASPSPGVPNRMAGHLKVVAVLDIVIGIFGMLATIMLLFAFGIATTATHAASGVPWLPGFLAGLGILLALLVGAFAAIWLVAGILLNGNRRAGKILGTIAAVLNLPIFPIGTAFGAYSLWVLFQRDTDAILR